MKICFITYEGVPFTKGGPYVKILELKKHFEVLGHHVELFNIWTSSDTLKEFDAVHLFGANFSMYGIARLLKNNNIRAVVLENFY